MPISIASGGAVGARDKRKGEWKKKTLQEREASGKVRNPGSGLRTMHYNADQLIFAKFSSRSENKRTKTETREQKRVRVCVLLCLYDAKKIKEEVARVGGKAAIHT